MNNLAQVLAKLPPAQQRLFQEKLNQLHRQQVRNSSIPLREDRTQPGPLSFAQQRLWFLDQWMPGSPYHIHFAVRIRGRLVVELLQYSFKEVVRRHEALRTTFIEVEGQPYQVIASQQNIPLPVIDLSGISVGEHQREVMRLAAGEAERAFGLARGPLLRTTLLRLAAQEHVLLLTMHHIIADGWSISLLLGEVAELYSAALLRRPSSLKPLPVQYADYARWQRQWLTGEVLETQLSYWRTKLHDAPASLQLPLDHPRSAIQTFRGATQSRLFPCSLRDGLLELGRRENATLFMVLLAGFSLLLWKYTNQDDISLGTPIANRNHWEIEQLIGFFVNTLVLRIRLERNQTFRDFLRQVRDVCLDAYAHQDIPFERLVEEFVQQRDLSRTPLFQVMISSQDVPITNLAIPDLELTPLDVETTTAKFDLSLDILNGERALHISLEYNTDLFESTTIAGLLTHYQTVLSTMVAYPDRPIATLSLLSSQEYNLLVHAWNATDASLPATALVHELIAAQAARTPQAIAVVWGTSRLSYQELETRANHLAAYLRTRGVGPEVPVGIYLERSLETVVSQLAILKAGGVCLPLDEYAPLERLITMLQGTQTTLVLTQHSLGQRLARASTSSLTLLYLDQELPDLPLAASSAPPPSLQPENLALIIYTSGSTGAPKGAMITHAGLCNYAHFFAQRYQLSTRIKAHLQMASSAFDLFMGDMLRALTTGARLVLCPRETLLDPPALYALMRREGVDSAEFVPAVLKTLVEYVQSSGQSLDFMNLLTTGADSLPVADYEQVRQVVGTQTLLINAYGLTEATIDNTHWMGEEVPATLDGVMPIGRPIANTRSYIVDPWLNPVPLGVQGELVIGGLGVGRGYYNQAGLTAERFLPDPFSNVPGARLFRSGDMVRYRADGTIEFLGRIDHQVKIRGFRIEPGEIEAALGEHPAIDQAIVVAREDTPGNKYLAAYVVPRPGKCPTPAELQAFVGNLLPKYMVPAAFVVMKAIPLTLNGKLDRKNLPIPELHSPVEPYVAPRTETEKALATIWQDLLGLEQIGIHQDFFSLGGHSLLAPQLMFRLYKAFGVRIPLRILFDTSTIARLASAVDAFRENKEPVLEAEETPLDLSAEASIAIPYPQAARLERYPGQFEAIFLTGVTGFLGAYLLDELLRETRADIYCLVRANSVEEGKKRIQRNLEEYALWNEATCSRIIPVLGDLALPDLGLSTAQFRELAARVDTIYHCGAWVNFTYPYHMLKAVNVDSVRAILHLAGEDRLKPINFISTLSVFDSSQMKPGQIILEDSPLEVYQGQDSGYAQSKWVAERLLQNARSLGFPVTIYRLGLVGAHSQTGIGHVKDLTWAMIKGCIQLGAAPKIHLLLDLIPVDFVSKAIIYLSRQPLSLNKAFHLFNTQPLSWMALVSWMNEQGYSIRSLPYPQWYAELRHAVEEMDGNALSPFFSIFPELDDASVIAQSPMVQSPQTEPFDTQNTSLGLANTSITCPPMDSSLLTTYFAYFVRTGFLRAPGGGRAFDMPSSRGVLGATAPQVVE
jgi:amino acid adenylation domain-containing protein/thioester reductase-like protein